MRRSAGWTCGVRMSWRWRRCCGRCHKERGHSVHAASTECRHSLMLPYHVVYQHALDVQGVLLTDPREPVARAHGGGFVLGEAVAFFQGMARLVEPAVP